jgi:Fic family protein
MFKPLYNLSDRVVNNLSQIAEIKAMVERSKLLPAREAFLRRAAIIKMAHTSTSIEGNQLKEYQVKELAEGKKVVAETDQIKEVENYLIALRHVDLISGNSRKITTNDILDIHSVVVNGLVDKEKQGKFRTGPVYIVNVLPKGVEELAYTPPISNQVIFLTDNLLEWLDNSTQIHPIIRAGLFHYQFVTIHPFTDGNGRTARLLTLLHLYQSGWDFNKVLVLEDYYNQNRKEYYKALQTGDTYKSRQGVDLSDWIEYFVQGFLEEANRVKDQILNLTAVSELDITRNILDTDELKIVDFVVTVGKITSDDVVDILRIPKRTAQSKLKKLEDIRVLVKNGAGPSTFYSLTEVA